MYFVHTWGAWEQQHTYMYLVTRLVADRGQGRIRPEPTLANGLGFSRVFFNFTSTMTILLFDLNIDFITAKESVQMTLN